MKPQVYSRQAFTLIELLVVVAIIALLVGILIPSLGAARDTARNVKCQSNLRQYGITFTAYSVDNDGVYCSGPFDNRVRWHTAGCDISDYPDGTSIETIGWAADAINGGYMIPGNLLCPTSPAQHHQNVNIDRLNDGGFRSYTVEERDDLVKRGFNSNYTQSWYMPFSEHNDRNDVAGALGQLCQSTVGPLRVSFMNAVGADIIPLFGDTKIDADELGEYDLNDHIRIGGQFLTTAKSLTDGYAHRDGRTWAYQDFSDFGAAHGKGKYSPEAGHDKTLANFVFADGHVATFRAENADRSFAPALDPTEEFRYIYPGITPGKIFGGRLSDGKYR
ncbi:MAG: type II secretion system protein [Planctomycetota bacterium]